MMNHKSKITIIICKDKNKDKEIFMHFHRKLIDIK